MTKISYKFSFNRSGKLNKRNLGLIELEVRQGKKRKYFTTKIYVEKGQFCDGRVVNHPLSNEYNCFLTSLKIEYEKIEMEYMKQDVYISLDMLKSAVKEHSAPSAKVIEFGTEIIESSSRKDKTKESYKVFFNIVFCEVAFFICHCRNFKIVKRVFLNQFSSFCLVHYGFKAP